MKFSVFLPCRTGSERVAHKNTKPFFNGKSLLQIKIEQLESCMDVDEILLSTDDNIAIAQAREIASNKLRVDVRDNDLCLSSTKLNDLIYYVGNLYKKDDVVLWTHVTSPMFDKFCYSKAIKNYKENLPIYDSLMSGSELQNFIYSSNGPVNFNGTNGTWPRTQDLPKWIEINSACFIASGEIYQSLKNRIGRSPYIMKTSHMASIDIDTEEDFEIAQIIYNAKNRVK
jgi:CMP-N-acetylneuraminic acid synthetase